MSGGSTQTAPPRLRALAALALAACAAQPAATDAATPPTASALRRSEFVADEDPVPSVHASTLAETPEGLVAAWFGGPHEGHADVCIFVSRLVDGAWSAPVVAAQGRHPEGARVPTWNPVLHQAEGGPLLLFYKVGPSPSTWWGELRTSDDGGRTWSAPRRLPEGILGPVKDKPLQLADGALLCPSSEESAANYGVWTLHFERTPDLGATWTRTPPLHDGVAISAIQPTLLRLPDGRLRALARTRQGRVAQVDSLDGGRTWGALTLTALAHSNSGLDAVTLRDGRHVLVHNDTTEGRSPLGVSLSPDGATWTPALVLEDEPGAEFSYPAVIQTRDGLVHVTYTWKRREVKHVVLDPARLAPAPGASVTHR